MKLYFNTLHDVEDAQWKFEGNNIKIETTECKNMAQDVVQWCIEVKEQKIIGIDLEERIVGFEKFNILNVSDVEF